tara:strand:+ start:17283 stop:17774 length:492 start_codon:yes stop_codon:yes gene_type:complete
MNKILLLEKNISYINLLINDTAKSLGNINESYLHKNLNNEGWTLRHFICFLISLNKMILNLDQCNTKKLSALSLEKKIRKYIGEEMFKIFSLRKDNLVEILQQCPKINDEHVKQIERLQDKIKNFNNEEKIDLYALINIKTKQISDLSKNLDQINGYLIEEKN